MGNEKESSSSSSSSVLLTPKNEPRTIPKKVAATHNTKMGVWLGLFFHPTHSLYTHQTREKKSKCHGESGLPRRKKEKSKKQQTIPPDDVSSTGEKKMGDSEAGRKKSWRETGCAIFLFWRHFLKGPGYCLLFPAECKRIFVVQQCKGSKHLPRNAACVATKKFFF